MNLNLPEETLAQAREYSFQFLWRFLHLEKVVSSIQYFGGNGLTGALEDVRHRQMGLQIARKIIKILNMSPLAYLKKSGGKEEYGVVEACGEELATLKRLWFKGKVGFRVVRQRESHVILKHSNGRLTVVSAHRGKDVGRDLLLKIIKDAGLTREEFLKLLEEI